MSTSCLLLCLAHVPGGAVKDEVHGALWWCSLPYEGGGVHGWNLQLYASVAVKGCWATMLVPALPPRRCCLGINTANHGTSSSLSCLHLRNSTSQSLERHFAIFFLYFLTLLISGKEHESNFNSGTNRARHPCVFLYCLIFRKVTYKLLFQRGTIFLSSVSTWHKNIIL